MCPEEVALEKKPEKTNRTTWIGVFAGRVFDWLHSYYIIQAAITGLYLGVLAVWAGFSEYMRQGSLVEFLTSTPVLMVTSIFFFVAFSVSIIVLRWYRQTMEQKLRHHLALQCRSKKNDVIKNLSTEASYRNALCDMTLFRLFHGLLRWIPAAMASLVIAELKAAHTAVIGNIEDQANVIQKALTTLLSRHCSVAIKLLTTDEMTPAKSKVRAFLRDTTSASQRGRVDDTVYLVEDNTAFIELALHGKAIFVCDDLPALAANGLYINERPRWKDDYTATIVVPIFEIIPAYSNDSQKVLGFLCADNFGGGFEMNPDVERCIYEIAWRLSVMLYRHRQLESLVSSKPVFPTPETPASTRTERRKNLARGGR
jgi:hypothetical protein